jgi:hypothetical protein
MTPLCLYAASELLDLSAAGDRLARTCVGHLIALTRVQAHLNPRARSMSSRLRRHVRVTLILAAVSAIAAPLRAQTSVAGDSAAVMRTLDRFLLALRSKDTTMMQSVFHPDARFTLLRPASATSDSVRVVVLTGPQFARVASNTSGPVLDEPIRQPRLLIDAHLATVWAEYQVRVNGGVSHCGYDAFQLVRTGAGWRILNVADTFRRTGCGAVWP